ncbi:MAG: putative glycoside hydrolase [Gemmatimonadaceae bacterium]
MRRGLGWLLCVLPWSASGQQPKGGASTASYRCAGAPDSAVALLPDSIARLPAPLVATPTPLRGLYVNRWAALGTRMWELIRLATTTEVNALVIDVKDDRGFVLYRSRVPLAREIGADTNMAMRPDRLRALLDSMRSHDIYPIARIVVVKDPLLASKRLEWSIKRRDAPTKPWLDKNGRPWLDAHQDGPWGYAADLACEAVDLGFSEVQLDYVRFPDERRLIREAIFPLAQGRQRAQVIRDQLSLLRERLRSLGVPITADIFGLVTSDTSDMGIGQRLEQVATAVDAVLPMMYPSHYAPGSYGFARPNAHPYQVIDHGLKDAQRRLARMPGASRLVPWYQAFTLGAPHYDDAEVRAQMKAGYDNGVTGWMLWNPGSRYATSWLAPKVPSPH